MKEIDFWKFIDGKLVADFTVILLVVAESSKSSPGRAGFKMAISSDGKIAGTIGGGIMERNLVDECRMHLQNNNKINLIKRLYHNKTARGDKSGLICGGRQTIILKTLGQDQRAFVSGIIESYDKLIGGTLRTDDSSIVFGNERKKGKNISFSYNSENEWSYEENSGFPNTIYIIGCGHVGLAVSKVMSTQDFYIVAIDPREDILTITNNSYANKIINVPYDEAGKYIIEGNRSYAVITTYGHATDIVALKSIINKNLRYIGLMGSKKKIDLISKNLIESGINPEQLNKIHSPIGIEIEAGSPEEIAISIAAEIIKVKNSKIV